MTTTIRLPDMAAFEALRNRDTRRIVQGLREMPTGPPLPPPVNPVRNPRGGHKRGEMNKSESFFSGDLDFRKGAGEISDWRFEEITLRLADGCTYTPDFDVWMASGELVFYEVKRLWKGKTSPHWEDDARVKVKVAAKQFRGRFQFFGVHWDGEKWVYEEF